MTCSMCGYDDAITAEVRGACLGGCEPEHATLADGTVLRDRTWAELRDGGYPVRLT